MEEEEGEEEKEEEESIKAVRSRSYSIEIAADDKIMFIGHTPLVRNLSS